MTGTQEEGSLCCRPRAQDGLFFLEKPGSATAGTEQDPVFVIRRHFHSNGRTYSLRFQESAERSRSQPADVYSFLFPMHRCVPGLRLPAPPAQPPLPAWRLTSEGQMPRLRGDHVQGTTCSAPEPTGPPNPFALWPARIRRAEPGCASTKGWATASASRRVTGCPLGSLPGGRDMTACAGWPCRTMQSPSEEARVCSPGGTGARPWWAVGSGQAEGDVT